MSVFNVAEMLARAERETGLSDWGGDEFREPFAILVNAINEEAQLTEQGLTRTRIHLDNTLAYRLRLVNDRKTRPEIARQEISKPLFMSGMGRAGTSFLNSMIASDPENLAPLHWQMWCPSPPPNDPAIDHSAEVERCRYLLNMQGMLSADVMEKHAYGVFNAEEDVTIHEFSFLSGAFMAWWDTPSYFQHLYSCDYTPAYRMLKQVLQAMQVGVPVKRWVLKSPDHMAHIDALFNVFPDARMVMNHRDPSKVMPSVLSLLAALRRLFGNKPLELDRKFALGFMEVVAAGLEHVIALRRDPETNRRFVDISYLDLERDPLSQVEKVYAHMGRELSDTARNKIKDYVADNRKGKFGKHRYRLSDYGLRQEEVHERFQFYFKQFDIPREAGA